MLKQLELVEKVYETKSKGIIVFCKHPPIVTLGRSTKLDDLTTWSGAKLEVSRGGRATYHGPSQLVIYPIINLNFASPKRPAKDVTSYLRNFENAIVQMLENYGLKAQGRSLQKKSEESDSGDETGVWIDSQKIASLGIAVRKWVTYHGAAINVHADPMAFQGLMPCGFQPSVMVDLESLTKKKIDEEQLKLRLRAELELVL